MIINFLFLTIFSCERKGNGTDSSLVGILVNISQRINYINSCYEHVTTATFEEAN